MSRVVLITGTATGFGNLAVPLYLERGWTVIATMRNASERGESVFGSLKKNGRLHLLELDVVKPEDWASAASYIDEKLAGRLDVLVNNAGYGLMGTLEDQTMEQLRTQFEVNFFGLAGLTRALLPHLRRSRGRILNLSSIGGLVTIPMFGSYNATKFAVEGLTEGLYYELKPLGVQVGLIEPGGFKTDFVSRSLVTAARTSDPTSAYAAINAPFMKLLETSAARGDDPMKVARKIVHLSEVSRVPLRTLVGVDAHLFAFLRRVLPHSLRVGVTAWMLFKLLDRFRR